jgi:menaquinone-specific isochorismate synthase
VTLTRTLAARTVPLGTGRPDLAAVASAGGVLLERDGTGLAGRGVAARIDLPGGLADPQAGVVVAAALAAIEGRDEVGAPGCGPVAVAALPFDPYAPASLVVPALLVGTDGTQSWLTTVGPAAPDPEPWPTAVPDAFTLTPPVSHRDWCALVERAVAAIRDGRFDKVVLAREVVVDANAVIHVGSVLERLRALYPSCVVFSVDGFVGASPELLVSRRGATVRSHPLAGTIPRSGDPHTDAAAAQAFLASAKERAEHDYVVSDVARALGPYCEGLQVPAVPSVLPLRNVSHLGTLITGDLAPGRHQPSALELAARLHPTAAVGGTPRPAALAWLAEHEGMERGPYAGAVGWVDAAGNGEWMVGIRSALIDGARARLFAGVGVVADSDPAAELAETQLKLQAVLAALVRP